MFIDGRWTDGDSGEWIEGINPATEEVISATPVGSRSDLDTAITAARRAFDDGPWPRMTPDERSAALVRFAAILRRRHLELTNLTVAESGAVKGPFSGALGCAAWIEDTATRAVGYSRPQNLHTLDSPSLAALGHPFAGGAVVREPIGVVAAVTPFNAAGIVTSWKVAARTSGGQHGCSQAVAAGPFAGGILRGGCGGN
jgi:acyl-CoA reductase-like NAD-dependent aldehyde dehydrogenase